MAGLSRKGKSRPKPAMNVTPLVDVVLVLLIIFMVIIPGLTAHFRVHVPSRPDEAATPPPPSAQNDNIVVSVTAEGRIRINRDEYSDEEFPRRLTRALAASGERKIFFDAHDDTPFHRASRALDLARGAGATNIAISTTTLN